MTIQQQITAIIKCTEAVTAVSLAEMQSESHNRHIADARKIVFFMLQKYVRATKMQSGKQLNRHYSTVIIAIRQAKNLIATEPKFAALAEEVERNYKDLFHHQ